MPRLMSLQRIPGRDTDFAVANPLKNHESARAFSCEYSAGNSALIDDMRSQFRSDFHDLSKLMSAKLAHLDYQWSEQQRLTRQCFSTHMDELRTCLRNITKTSDLDLFQNTSVKQESIWPQVDAGWMTPVSDEQQTQTVDLELSPRLRPEAYREPAQDGDDQEQNSLLSKGWPEYTTLPDEGTTNRSRGSIWTRMSVSTSESICNRLSGFVARARADASVWKWLVDVVNSCSFTFLSASLIIFNAVILACETDYNLHLQMNLSHGDSKLTQVDWDKLDMVLCWVFLVELIIRVIAFRLVFFVGPESGWNVFDLLIVVSSFVAALLQSHDGSEISVFRVIRLIRLVRIISTLRRFPCFRNLEHMLSAIFHAFPALAPAMLLLILFIFTFSLVFMQGVENYLRYVGSERNTETDELRLLFDTFGSVRISMETLFMCIVGGMNWKNLLEVLREVGTFYEITFLVYVAFVTFAVLNILTGIFVDAAHEFTSLDRELAAEMYVDQELECMKGLQDLFREADKDFSGTLSWEEFLSFFRTNEVRAYLKGMDLNVTSLKKIFELIDRERTGEIDLHAFVETCMQLRGGAQVVDIAIMFSDLEDVLEHKITMLCESFGRMGTQSHVTVNERSTSIHTSLGRDSLDPDVALAGRKEEGSEVIHVDSSVFSKHSRRSSENWTPSATSIVSDPIQTCKFFKQNIPPRWKRFSQCEKPSQ